METLYPLHTTTPADGDDGSVTVLVNRTVARDEEGSFLAKLTGLLEDFDRFPGTSGSMVFRREIGGEVEFSVLQRFAKKADHDAWIESGDFARWRSEVAPPEPAPGHVHRYSGMESFFVTARAPDAPPRWKMALLLMIAVYPLSLAISHWFAPALARVPLFAGTLITSVFMVAAMTYAIVPVLTKVFGWWLDPAEKRRGAR